MLAILASVQRLLLKKLFRLDQFKLSQLFCQLRQECSTTALFRISV